MVIIDEVSKVGVVVKFEKLLFRYLMVRRKKGVRS